MLCQYGACCAPDGLARPVQQQIFPGRSWRTGAAGGDGQEGPGQQRLARWDPGADREDRLALERLTQRAAALSGHPSPTAVSSLLMVTALQHDE